QPRFKRALVVLIDALRFDFAQFDASTKPDAESYYKNKLPILHHKLMSEPQGSVLFRARADPPTTTLQRLKALVTGTLPTFVDAGSNFGSSAIAEDNLISQLNAQGRRLLFMGDDTWVGLFPTQFNESHPYPSFNVQDLHTVDNGCIEHLFPLLDGEKGDWDLAVAHFLGVDHVGHSFGPDTVPMLEKLGQVNGWLTHVFDAVDKDTLVVVLGDHGMDPKGDHGGDSENEVNAALFLYSKQALLPAPRSPGDLGEPFVFRDGIRTLPQIDLVPTLSALLGVPIPFGNLGSVIPELFYGADGVSGLLRVARANAVQMHTYLDEYSRQGMAADFSLDKLTVLFNEAEASFERVAGTLSGNAAAAISATDAEELRHVYIQYMKFTRMSLMSARRVWARFDVPLIILGVGTFAVTIAFGCFVTWRWWITAGGFSVLSMAAFVGLGLLGAALAPSTDVVKRVMGGTHRYAVKMKHSSYRWINLTQWILAISLLASWVGVPASDSFTIYEESVTLHLLQTFGVFIIFIAFNAKRTDARNTLLVHAVSFITLTRFKALSTICREEKAQTCSPTFNALPNSSVASPTAVFGLLAMIPAVLIAVRRALEKTDSLHGTGQFLATRVVPAGLCVSFFYWVLDTLQGYQQFVGAWAFMIPLKIYWAKTLFLAAGVVSLYVWASEPTCMGTTTVTRKEELLGDGVKAKYKVLLGLGNPIGASYLAFLGCVYLVLCMFQKPMGGVMLGASMLQIVGLVELFSILRDEAVAQDVVLLIVGQQTYFSTGHQFTMSSIQWELSFVGLFEVSWILSPIMMNFNTFGGPILSLLSLPLLALWKRKLAGGALESRMVQEVGAVFLIGTAIGVGVWGFSATALAGHFRRHLMVWSVYAPKMLGTDVGVVSLSLHFIVFGIGALVLAWDSYATILSAVVDRGF
ncbi:alkaline-phosphatase-like protein, partial [Chytriomyces sp. MP71]